MVEREKKDSGTNWFQFGNMTCMSTFHYIQNRTHTNTETLTLPKDTAINNAYRGYECKHTQRESHSKHSLVEVEEQKTNCYLSASFLKYFPHNILLVLHCNSDKHLCTFYYTTLLTAIMFLDALTPFLLHLSFFSLYIFFSCFCSFFFSFSLLKLFFLFLFFHMHLQKGTRGKMRLKQVETHVNIYK